MISYCGRILASVALLSYVAALLFEAWRPGSVTYFWNPQILLLLAVIGAAVGTVGTAPARRWWRTIVFFAALAIVGALLVWHAFSPSSTRALATVGTVLLVAGATFPPSKPS